MHIAQLEKLITRRDDSLFEADFQIHCSVLSDNIRRARILVIGAAGSIGSAFVREVLKFQPRSLWLVDPSENNLVEVVRELRSSNDAIPDDFGTVSIGFESTEFEHFFSSKNNFDYILNFAALKHVRSERDPYSLMRLLNVNVLANKKLIEQCRDKKIAKIFCVSSDKAVNPHSLMGASKAFMERLFLGSSDRFAFSSARFANVTFSDGSLLHGFLKRFEKRQPLSAPTDIYRYFITHKEAAQLCLMACFIGRNKEIFVPKLSADKDLLSFSEIAVLLLETYGFKPLLCDSENEARNRAKELSESVREYPCYFSKSNTDGEKTVEEFWAENEVLDTSLSNINKVIKPRSVDSSLLDLGLNKLATIRDCVFWDKKEIISAVRLVVPELKHEELGMNLDCKM